MRQVDARRHRPADVIALQTGQDVASVGAVHSTPDPRTRPVTAGSAVPGAGPAVFALDLSGPPVDGDLDLLDEVEVARARRLVHEADRDLVGVMGHRSAELVAAVLGVVGAGCAYVPLDPS